MVAVRLGGDGNEEEAVVAVVVVVVCVCVGGGGGVRACVWGGGVCVGGRA